MQQTIILITLSSSKSVFKSGYTKWNLRQLSLYIILTNFSLCNSSPDWLNNLTLFPGKAMKCEELHREPGASSTDIWHFCWWSGEMLLLRHMALINTESFMIFMCDWQSCEIVWSVFLENSLHFLMGKKIMETTPEIVDFPVPLAIQ